MNTSYEDLLAHVLVHGIDKTDRTGTGTRSIFGHQLRFDLAEGFPLITSKEVRLSSVVVELLWFLRGGTNVAWLNERGVHIWDEWRQPYSEDRPMIMVSRRSAFPGGEYEGDFSCRGLHSKKDSVNTLADTWVKMMRRCYDTNHRNWSGSLTACRR